MVLREPGRPHRPKVWWHPHFCHLVWVSCPPPCSPTACVGSAEVEVTSLPSLCCLEVLCCIDHHQWGLVPIQKNQGTPGETRNTAACLLTVGLSWFGFEGLTAVMISSPFAWFVIQSALCNDNPIKSLSYPLPSSSLHFSCLKTTRLSLSQSFLFTNISKVNGCWVHVAFPNPHPVSLDNADQLVPFYLS